MLFAGRQWQWGGCLFSTPYEARDRLQYRCSIQEAFTMISLGNLLSRFRRLAWRRCSPTALGSAGQAHAASRVPRIGQQHKLQAISGTHRLCSHLNGRASRSIAIAAGLVILSMALATATALAEPHIID